jgi:hypothetical protein
VGDVADLIGQPAETFTDPDTAPAADLLPPALDTIKALLVEGCRLRESEARLSRELDETRRELDLARRSTAEKTVQSLETSRPGRFALRAYRTLRRR